MSKLILELTVDKNDEGYMFVWVAKKKRNTLQAKHFFAGFEEVKLSVLRNAILDNEENEN